MIKLSALCPVSFAPVAGGVGMQRDYIQKFATGDRIYIQLHGDAGKSLTIELHNAIARVIVSSGKMSEYEMVSSGAVYETVLTPVAGVYYVTIKDGADSLKSNFFEVSANERDLQHLAIIDYGFSTNGNLFNTRFVGDSSEYRFRFRVEGGFLADSDTPGLENEFFRNQLQQPEQLYQYPYVKSRLTIGNATGVPQWVGTLLNNILCCGKVSIDGIEYVRSESSVPERVKIGAERYPLFQFNVEVERDVIASGIEILNIPTIRMVSDGVLRIIASKLWRRV